MSDPMVQRSFAGRRLQRLVLGATCVLTLGAIGGLIALHLADALSALTRVASSYLTALIATLAGSAILLLTSVATLRIGLRSPQRSQGRARLISLGAGALPLAAAFGALSAMILIGERQAVETGMALTFEVDEALLGVPPLVGAAYPHLLAIAILGASVAVLAIILAWFLIPLALRSRFWLVFDGLVLVAFIWTSATLPIAPGSEASEEETLMAAIRLGVTAIFCIRLLVRSIAPLLDLLERPGFLWLVASRLIRSRKSNFLTAIGGLSILAVAFSSCMLTSVLSFMGGFRQDLKDKILGNHAHVLVHQQHGTFADWQSVLTLAEHTPGVEAASPYVMGEVMVSSASTSDGAILRGIDTATIGAVLRLPRDITIGDLGLLDRPEDILHEPGKSADPSRGSKASDGGSSTRTNGSQGKESAEADSPEATPTDGTNAPAPSEPAMQGGSLLDDLDRYIDPSVAKAEEVLPGLLIGQELARTLRVYQGDEIEVVSPRGRLGPTGPIPKVRRFRVAGIFYTGMYEYDMKHIYAALPVAQRFLNVDDDISGIQIRVENVDDAPAVALELASKINRPALRVQDWEERNQQLFGALALEKLAMFIVLGIALVIAGFCVFGTFTLMVQEKRREVGVLKAMGARSGTVVALFMAQGLLIGALGAGIGLGLGFLTAFASERFGIRINPEVYYIDRLPVHVDPTEFGLVALVAVTICLVATILPAYVASRLAPVDALRYD